MIVPLKIVLPFFTCVFLYLIISFIQADWFWYEYMFYNEDNPFKSWSKDERTAFAGIALLFLVPATALGWVIDSDKKVSKT